MCIGSGSSGWLRRGIASGLSAIRISPSVDGDVEQEVSRVLKAVATITSIKDKAIDRFIIVCSLGSISLFPPDAITQAEAIFKSGKKTVAGHPKKCLHDELADCSDDDISKHALEIVPISR